MTHFRELLGQKYKNMFNLFGSNENFKICFRDLLTFSRTIHNKLRFTLSFAVSSKICAIKSLLSTKYLILHWIKVSPPKPSPCNGVCRGRSRPWGTLQIRTCLSGNRHSISLTLETNKHLIVI